MLGVDHAIEAAALTRMYGPSAGVDGVDLTVRAGECFGFLGPNGAGKTTFIRLTLGLIRATSGDVSVMGHDVHLDRMAALAQVGYLPGELGLYAGLTGRRTLDALARLHPRAAGAARGSLRRPWSSTATRSASGCASTPGA